MNYEKNAISEKFSVKFKESLGLRQKTRFLRKIMHRTERLTQKPGF
jgi:hypothetical protein